MFGLMPVTLFSFDDPEPIAIGLHIQCFPLQHQELFRIIDVYKRQGISYMYLPPYSPDLNPIEKMWSKMKSILRKRKIRIASELPEAVKAALGAVSTNDCKGWFRSCGICTN